MAFPGAIYSEARKWFSNSNSISSSTFSLVSACHINSIVLSACLSLLLGFLSDSEWVRDCLFVSLYLITFLLAFSLFRAWVRVERVQMWKWKQTETTNVNSPPVSTEFKQKVKGGFVKVSFASARASSSAEWDNIESRWNLISLLPR